MNEQWTTGVEITLHFHYRSHWVHQQQNCSEKQVITWSVCSAGLLPVVPLSPRPLPHVGRLQRAPEREGESFGVSECKSEFKGAAHFAVRVHRSWPSAWSSASPSPWWPSTSSSFLARSTGRSPPSPLSRYLSPCPGLPRGGGTERQSCQHQCRITAPEKKRAFFPSAEEEGKCPDVQIRRTFPGSLLHCRFYFPGGWQEKQLTGELQWVWQ